MTQVAIIGGHGKIALKLGRILSGDGHQVTSIIRSADQKADITGIGATPVVLDVANSTTDQVADAVRGADVVVFAAGAGGGDAERTYAVDRDAAIRTADAASAAGIRRFVLVSYFGASIDHGVPEDDSFYAYAEAKGEADAYVKKSDLDWTIVAPGSLTDDAGTGAITTKEQDADGGDVSRDDVAAVLAAVIAKPSTAGKMIEFIGGDTTIADAI